MRIEPREHLTPGSRVRLDKRDRARKGVSVAGSDAFDEVSSCHH